MSEAALPRVPWVFLGFRAKRVAPASGRATEGPACGGMQEICSVSDCLSKAPPDWVERWDFNAACCYDSESAALAAVPAGEAAGYELFAYRLCCVRFDRRGATPLADIAKHLQSDLPPLPQETELPGYSEIGYDLAGGSLVDPDGSEPAMLGFGCSPLSCNGYAGVLRVNRYCLIDDLGEAMAAGIRFGCEEPEPGPFYLYSVYRKGVHRP